MGWYYHAVRSVATNATPFTENATDLLVLTGSAINCAITTVTISSRVSGGGTSLSGALVNFKRFGTAGSGGSALTTVGKANPNNPTKVTGITTGASIGTTAALQKSVGCAAPGGAGGWMAIDRDDSMKLLPAGGANGNMETSTIGGVASVTLDYGFDFMED